MLREATDEGAALDHYFSPSTAKVEKKKVGRADHISVKADVGGVPVEIAIIKEPGKEARASLNVDGMREKDYINERERLRKKILETDPYLPYEDDPNFNQYIQDKIGEEMQSHPNTQMRKFWENDRKIRSATGLHDDGVPLYMKLEDVVDEYAEVVKGSVHTQGGPEQVRWVLTTDQQAIPGVEPDPDDPEADKLLTISLTTTLQLGLGQPIKLEVGRYINNATSATQDFVKVHGGESDGQVLTGPSGNFDDETRNIIISALIPASQQMGMLPKGNIYTLMKTRPELKPIFQKINQVGKEILLGGMGKVIRPKWME